MKRRINIYLSMNNTGSPKRKQILLVEDDPLLVNLYKEKFENEGFGLLVAEDGEAGLELALDKKETVDIVILDLLLPKMSGIEILSELKKVPEYEKIPIIVLTNMSRQEENRKALELGAKEYLIKADLTPSQLVEKVRTYFDN